jgi:hypothetical protein
MNTCVAYANEEPAPHERRRIQRTLVTISAKLIVNDRPSLVDCVVRDLTNVGACLELASARTVPDAFDLTFDSARSSRRCQVRWRSQDRVGVAFG